jgi:hypothetical protein
MGVTPALKAGDSFVFTAGARNPDNADVYYRFYYCANYGTSAYETTDWTLVQDYSTTNTCTYTLPSNGSYVLVARAVIDPYNEPEALPIIGSVVTVGDDSAVQLTSLSASTSGVIKSGDAVLFTATAGATAEKSVYYQFYYCANYGTSAYETTNWTLVKEYSTDNTCTITFPAPGNYVVVVRAVLDPDNEPQALPVIGNIVMVQ